MVIFEAGIKGTLSQQRLLDCCLFFVIQKRFCGSLFHFCNMVIRSRQKLFKLLGVGEPTHKIVPVLLVELQTPNTVKSGSGMADYKQQVQVGLARLWAVKVNMDERYSILWQLEVIKCDNSFYENIVFALLRQGFLYLKNNIFAPIYSQEYSISSSSQ